MPTLTEQRCVPCSGKSPQATDEEIREYMREIPDWHILERDGVKQLERSFAFDNFRQGLDFVNDVGNAAELEDHHPRIVLEYKVVTVTWWTHAIQGLHRNDFIMAAKTDELYGP